MLSCLFCNRKKRLFKIDVIYGETACPIKDYILQFFGPVEKYLNKDQGICKTCVFVLNNLLYIKNFMYQALVSIAEDACKIQPELAFACMFRLFRHNLKKVDYDRSKSGQSSPELFTSSKSQNNELVEASVQNVDEDYEVQSNHSLLREDTPSADREVQRVLSKRKKRRSSERGIKTVLSRSNSLASFHSEPVYKKRWSTDLSDFGNSDYSEDDRAGSSKLRFNKDGILLNRKTRSVSRIISKSDAAYAEYTERTYKCVDGCTREFDDLMMMTEHKIEDHKMLAKYWCYECYKIKFTSQEDLDKHNNIIHKILITNCPLCSEEMQNQEELQRHLGEHRIHSVPCNYCDKYFLNGSSCETHIREHHRGRKKRIKRRRPQTILDRIDKEVANGNGAVEEHSVNDAESFVKLLIQNVPVEEEQPIAEIAHPGDAKHVSNIDEDSSSCNCDEDNGKQQEPTEVNMSPAPEENIDDTGTLEERSSETGCSTCDVEEEICVTALEETFLASVQEINFTYVVNNELCPIQGEENKDVYSYPNANEEIEIREEGQVQSYNDDYGNCISNICHEEVVTDNTEYLGGESDQFENNLNQTKTGDEGNNHGECSNTESEFQTSEVHQEEVEIDKSDNREINELNADSLANVTVVSRGTSLEVVPPKMCSEENYKEHEHELNYVVSVSDQNKTNSQLNSTTSNLLSERTPKKPRNTQKIRKKSLGKEKKSDDVVTPDRPQLKIVLERLKIGNDFLQNLLGKPRVASANNTAPSTSLVSKTDVVNTMKKKRRKKVTANVKTPVHYRKLIGGSGKVYREKKYVKKLSSGRFEDKTLKNKLDIYDFKDEDEDGDSRTKITKNSQQHKAKSKPIKVFKDAEIEKTLASVASKEDGEFASASVKTNIMESDRTNEKYRTSTKVKGDRLDNSSLKGNSKRKQV